MIHCHMATSVLSASSVLTFTSILWSRYYSLFRDAGTEKEVVTFSVHGVTEDLKYVQF